LTDARTKAAGAEEIRKFGLLFAAIFVLVAAYLAWRGSARWPYAAAPAAFFFAAAFVAQPVLRPIHRGWMRFAYGLAWINTRILLGGMFFLVLTPIGLLLRLTGRDLLNQRIDPAAPTYWIKRPRKPFDPDRARMQF
jgi:hypothetical protein